MGIIITPGSFAPPPPPGALRSVHFPLFPAPRSIQIKRDYQYSTRWQGGDTPTPPPTLEFDDSPMAVPGVVGWISRVTSTLWAHQRMVTMRAEWQDLPPAVTHIAVWFAATPVAAGSTSIDVSHGFQVLDSVDWVGETTGYDLWSSMIHGLRLNATGSASHGEIVYDTSGVVDHSISLSTTAANAVYLQVMNGPAALASFYISPVYASSIELREDSAETSMQTSERSVRVVWSEEDGYSLLTPGGFLVTQS
jgi:hypothetical protein